MPLRILTSCMLVLALNRLALAQDAAQEAESTTTTAPTATSPQVLAGATEVESSAPSSRVLNIETTADIERSEVLSKVVQALEKEGIAKRTNEDRVGKPVEFHAVIRARRETPYDQIRQMIETLRTLSINGVLFGSEERDVSSEIIVSCPADVTWRKVREIQKALEKHKEFKFDVRVAANNDPVTPTTTLQYYLKDDVQYFPPSSYSPDAARPASGAPAKPADISGSDPDKEPITVLHVKHARAQDVALIIDQFFGRSSKPVTLAVDERTNTILVRGDNAGVAQVTDLLNILDVPEKKSTESTDGSQKALSSFDGAGAAFRIFMNRDVSSHGTVAELRQRYEALEQLSRTLAGNLKQPLKDPAEGQKQKESLRKSVQQTFAARQELQRAELTEFAKRLEQLQQSIELRNRIADKIVDRRVDELLDPNLNWVQSKVGGNPANDLNKRPVATLTAPPSDPTPGILGKLPAELHELLTERAKSVEQIQESIRHWEQKRTDGHDVKETESAVAGLQTQLVEYNRKLALAQRELSEQIQLLNAERQRDQNRLKAAVDALDDAKKLRAAGEATEQEVRTAEIALQDSKLTLQRTESLLKLYQQAGEGLLTLDVPAADLQISPVDPKGISASAWGEPVQGLKMAIVATSENAPGDQPQEVLCVVENISAEPITIRNSGGSLMAAKSDVRRTSGAQVQTMPNGKSGMSGGKVIELNPGQQAVLTTMSIRVTEDAASKSVPSNTDLLIVDNRAFEFRNAIYVLKCTLQLNLGNGEFLITSGPIAIAFHRPTEPTGTNNR